MKEKLVTINEKFPQRIEGELAFAPEKVPSTILNRLIDEVRNEEYQSKASAYNRFHNRHNKSR